MLDFLSVASEIVRNDPGLAPCRPVIEKELLHFEIEMRSGIANVGGARVSLTRRAARRVGDTVGVNGNEATGYCAEDRDSPTMSAHYALGRLSGRGRRALTMGQRKNTRCLENLT